MIYLKDREKFPLQLILREILLLNDTSVMTSSADAVKNAQLERKVGKILHDSGKHRPYYVLLPLYPKVFYQRRNDRSCKGLRVLGRNSKDSIFSPEPPLWRGYFYIDYRQERKKVP